LNYLNVLCFCYPSYMFVVFRPKSQVLGYKISNDIHT
jgi:hypothetical protein